MNEWKCLECSTGFPPTNQPLAGFTQQMCALFTLYEDTFRHSFSSEIICHSWVSLRQVGSGWTAEEDVVKSENSRCVGGGIGPAPESHNTLTLMSHSFFCFFFFFFVVVCEQDSAVFKISTGNFWFLISWLFSSHSYPGSYYEAGHF